MIRVVKRVGYYTGLAFSTIVMLELLYISAAAILLNTGLLEQLLNRHPEKSFIQWSSAWSVFPGVITVNSFDIAAQTPRIQWFMALDSATVRVDLPALMNRTFHVTDIHGNGLQFRLRRQPRILKTISQAFDYSPPIPRRAGQIRSIRVTAKT